MRLGASAYLLKTSAGLELFQAIEEALKGRCYVTEQIALGMEEAFARNPKERPKAPTPRQREVIQLLAEGKSLKQTAHILNVTPRTAAFHKYRIMDMMGFKTNAALIQFAIKENMIAP
jgi:DNA-binding NarL/FixJ family response regulator